MSAMFPDLYGPAHNGVGLALGDLLAEARSGNTAIPADGSRLEARWNRLAAIVDTYGFCEDLHIRPLVRIAAPEIADRLDAQHIGLDRDIGDIGEAFARLRGITGTRERRLAAAGIERALSAFAAACFRHVMEERRRALPALADRFPPVTLFAAERALMASLEGEGRLASAPLAPGAGILAPHDLRFIAGRGVPAATIFAEAEHYFRASAGGMRRPVATRATKPRPERCVTLVTDGRKGPG